MLGSKEQLTEGLKIQAHELIDQAYERGFNAGRESNAITIDKAIDFLRDDGWMYDNDKDTYEQASVDVWECARKIQLLSGDERYKIFGSESPIVDFDVRYCIAKIKSYEEQKKADDEEIKVGDEIAGESAHVVVTYINSRNEWNGFALNDCDACKPGQGYTGMPGFDGWEKTCRHFQQIVDILNRLREGEE